MPLFLGIDTSNYTTSAALYDSDSGRMLQKKMLLPVKSGECGLRQSDAVFHHVQQLPQVIQDIMENSGGSIAAVGVSSRPRDVEGSYMPCFTVGLGAARSVASILKIPVYTFSHQCGHIAAALFSAEKIELFRERFIAFHVSGGTTEAVIAQPDDEIILRVELAAKTLDLNAGQLIDRVGVMLGLQFPCGAELERLAACCKEKVSARPTLKGTDCCLSGVENLCRRAYEDGRSREYVSALCLEYVERTIEGMCSAVLEKYGSMPVVFAGGVMSDRLIRHRLEKRFGAFFAEPQYSADNAAGIAYLCCRRYIKD